MTEERAVVIKKADAPTEWGTRAEVGALADRLAAMLPNAKDLSKNEVLTAAQYCRLMDLNPFRGEVYFYKNRGQLCVVDGYKALTRWARNRAPYSERYEDMPTDDGQIVHVRCWIVRDDRRAIISEYRQMGATFKEAFEMVAVYGDGIVTKAESDKREPPVGWDWQQVARKRALKNAINLSHGAPSPREIAELSWQTNGGIQTLPEDWEGAEELGAHEAEKLAELRAQHRMAAENWAELSQEQQAAKVEKNSRQLYGDPEFEGFGDDDTTTTAAPIWDNSPPEWFEQAPMEMPEAGAQPLAIAKTSLLVDAQKATRDYYKHESHLLNAIRLEAGDDWEWTNILTPKGYGYALELAVSHAKKQLAS